MNLTFSEFLEALAMCALAAFASRRLSSSSSYLKQPEQKLAAFLSYLGLPALPGHSFLLSRAAGLAATGNSTAAAAAAGGGTGPSAGGRGGGGGGGSGEQRVGAGARAGVGVVRDPYEEWWGMMFDPEAENKARDYASSMDYNLVLLQVRGIKKGVFSVIGCWVPALRRFRGQAVPARAVRTARARAVPPAAPYVVRGYAWLLEGLVHWHWGYPC